MTAALLLLACVAFSAALAWHWGSLREPPPLDAGLRVKADLLDALVELEVAEWEASWRIEEIGGRAAGDALRER